MRNKHPLRFLTCGSADDGKSTLIGRLFDDCKQVHEDRLAALAADSKRAGDADAALDLPLPMEGLRAEREQGIGIDVAYRYFATSRRKFLVADTPGHERCTRDMASGASACDFAVLVVDARQGVVTQTRRHACILSLLGVGKAALAVNKMDLVGFSKDRFDEIAAELMSLAGRLGFEEAVTIPVSALLGDNVIAPSANMHWYRGPTLLAHLETVTVERTPRVRPFRMGVQWVRAERDFRGYAGTIASGALRIGDEVVVMSSGRRTRVARIVTCDGEIETAQAGDAVTVTLTDNIDIKRGDMLAAADAPADLSDQIAAHVVWMADEPMLPGRAYLLKAGSQTATATVTALKHKIDVDNLGRQAGKTLALNEAGLCNISFDRPLAFDPYSDSRETGGFTLVDRLTNAALGVGTIVFGLRRATNLQWQELAIDKRARAGLKHQRPCVLWFTGLSGAGKSTVAGLLEKKLHERGRHTYVLDGDNVRHGLNRDLGFTDADRVENIRRVAETAKLFVDAGLIVMVSFISPFRSERRMARALFAPDEFVEVFVDAPLEVCEARDPKGLYKKARAGQIANFTGIDSLYEPPEHAELHLRADVRTPEVLTEALIAELERRKAI